MKKGNFNNLVIGGCVTGMIGSMVIIEGEAEVITVAGVVITVVGLLALGGALLLGLIVLYGSKLERFNHLSNNLKSALKNKLNQKFHLKSFLPKNKAEEILGDLSEVKTHMQAAKQPKTKIWWYLTKTKLNIILRHQVDRIFSWIEQQTKISK